MSELPPNIQPPTNSEIEEMAARHYIDLTPDEIEDFKAVIDDMLDGYERLDTLSASTPERTYLERDPGYKPDTDEDPLNAFVTKCHVEGANDGVLDGYEIGLKDSVALAGVEMSVGSKLFEGFVPKIDATIVTRMLDAGATITGKLNMEDMAFSGSGELSATGPVRNPYNEEYLAGGSSSGSAAAVGTGEVDVAIGGDQGGSIRIPASWSGIVGHKPTHGLVPYTGVVGLGWTFDHVGPMATSVSDCARVLDVIAGKDSLDPRQDIVETQSYTSLNTDISDITIGILEEGFVHEESEPTVNETVQGALDRFAEAGAEIQEVSVPMHLDGPAIWNGIGAEATAATLSAEGTGQFGKGYYDTQLMDAFGKARRAHADDYLATVKLMAILGEYLSEEYRSHYYGKAQNLARDLTAEYDTALSDVDVLAMPTTPQTAHEITDELSRLELIDRAFSMLNNTSPFDLTGHPALSVPCGISDGLPVGLMLVGERFDDKRVLEVGDAFESHHDWELFEPISNN